MPAVNIVQRAAPWKTLTPQVITFPSRNSVQSNGTSFIYDGLKRFADAQSVPGITGVSITAEPGQIVAPPPDGASYLGFIFSRTARPAEAENALRIAHSRLRFEIRPGYPAIEAPAAART